MKPGILVFSNKEILNHKQRDGMKSDDAVCFWETKKPPLKFVSKKPEEHQQIKADFALYFAINGKVKGYFIVHQIHNPPGPTFELHFHSETWTPINDGDWVTHSQGWRYYPRQWKTQKQ